MSLVLKCMWCGKDFEAQRKSAKFCSDSCRVANSRYDPVAMYNDAFDRAMYNIKEMHRLAVKHPEHSPEIDERFRQMEKLVHDYTFGENYKRVIDEERRRLL